MDKKKRRLAQILVIVVSVTMIATTVLWAMRLAL